MAFNLFNSIRVKTPKRHAFDLSHDVKMSCDLYKLVPILCEEVVPGDTWKVNTEILMRFAPLVSPVMHRLNVYTHFFLSLNVYYGMVGRITSLEENIALAKKILTKLLHTLALKFSANTLIQAF